VYWLRTEAGSRDLTYSGWLDAIDVSYENSTRVVAVFPTLFRPPFHTLFHTLFHDLFHTLSGWCRAAVAHGRLPAKRRGGRRGGAQAGWPEVALGEQVESVAPQWLKEYLVAKRAVEAKLTSTGSIRPVIFRPGGTAATSRVGVRRAAVGATIARRLQTMSTGQRRRGPIHHG